MPRVQVGSIVRYTLTEEDASQVNRRRTSPYSVRARIPENTWPVGAQAHIGVDAFAGDVLPAIVVATYGTSGMANLQVFLNGNDTLFVSGRTEHTDFHLSPQGFWRWPLPGE